MWVIATPEGGHCPFLMRPTRAECITAFDAWLSDMKWRQARRKGWTCVKMRCSPEGYEDACLRNTIGEARAWFDFDHLHAAQQGKVGLSGDAVRELRYAYDKLGNALLANGASQTRPAEPLKP
jgi:hypothetical protein